MQLFVQPINESQIREMVQWQYEPPYDIYNLDSPLDNVPEAITYFSAPEIRCHAIVDENGRFLAFCTFGEDATVSGGDYSAEALDIGLGVRPDYTGKGLGAAFVTAVIHYARTTYHPPMLRVTIAEVNTRAQRVWSQQGFAVQSRFEASVFIEASFLIMTWIPEST